VANREQAVRERFDRETAEHVLTIFRDDGLYRHLRCATPGTWAYGYDIVTWPGYLAIVGDAGDFVFSRMRDMFEFFESASGRINPGYWSQKLQAPHSDGARVYSHDALVERVHLWARDVCEWGDFEDVYPDLLIGALDREILNGWTHHEHEGRERLELFEQIVGWRETWEWDLREWDWQFVWCCYAIVKAIGAYWQSREAAAA
jgi:hypothetical protein